MVHSTQYQWGKQKKEKEKKEIQQNLRPEFGHDNDHICMRNQPN